MTIAIADEAVRLRGAGRPSRSLKVGGITPYSLRDYPGRPAAVVFVQGCPWRCGYCHNPHLQLRLPKSPLAWPRVLQLLEDRIGIIEAVLFSGGEPTVDAALADAVRDVRELGLRVGLHTAGAYPERLESVLSMLDWAVLDLKAPFDSYEKVTGVAGSGEQVRRSAQAILASGVAHEFRTTLHPMLLDEADLAQIGQDLAALRASKLVLQLFRPQGCRNKVLRNGMTGTAAYPSAAVLEKLVALVPGLRLPDAA